MRSILTAPAAPNACFALITRHYMNRYGATREDFGRICVAQRDNALAIPYALMKKPLTLEEYLAARAIADPDPSVRLRHALRRRRGLSGLPRGCRARSLDCLTRASSSTIERHNAFPDDPIQFRGGWAMDIATSCGRWRGITPDDVDFVQTYDDYPVIVMMQFEDLGFCAKGEGAEIRPRATRSPTDGDFPHNTSGGQLSIGQAGAAGGYLGLVEAVRQLIGAAARGRRCRDARSRPRLWLRYDQLRSRPVVRCRRACGSAHDRTADPAEAQGSAAEDQRSRCCPQGVRSRTAHGLTAAAAEGRFALQVCADCGP